MPGDVEFKIDGLQQMEKLLHELGPKIASKIAQRAVLDGAKVIVDEAKRTVPRASHALAKSMTVQKEKKKFTQPDEVVAIMGFKVPASRHAHLVEFGTKHSDAQPFFRPAMDRKAGEALDEMKVTLAAGLIQEARKLAKR